MKRRLLILAALLAAFAAAYRFGWDRGETSGAAQVMSASVRYVRERCSLPDPETSQPL